MKNFKFNLRSLEEMYSYGLVDPIDSIFEFMHHEIKTEIQSSLSNNIPQTKIQNQFSSQKIQH